MTVDDTVKTPAAQTGRQSGTALTFLQLGGLYRVTGRLADRTIDFAARGAAETFRPR